MRWISLAAKDLRDGYWARLLTTTVALFVVVSGIFSGAYSQLYRRTGAHPIEAGLPGLFLPVLSVLVPFVAVLATSDVIARKRRSGSIKVLLGLPYSRFDLVAGSFVGRAALLSGAILAMAVVSVAIVTVRIGSGGIRQLAGLFALSMALAAAFVSIGVGVSAVSRSSTRATAGTIGITICFVFRLWELVPYSVEYVANGFRLPGELPAWGLLWSSANPVVAYQRAAVGVVPDLARLPLLDPISASDPYYLRPSFAVVVLLAWIFLPAGLGYLRFRRSDL